MDQEPIPYYDTITMISICPSTGAGPGGAFSYHGGGHGGRGGGFYQDRNTSRFYGWSYYDTSYLLGGSTGKSIKVTLFRTTTSRNQKSLLADSKRFSPNDALEYATSTS